MAKAAISQQSIDVIEQFTTDVWNGRDYDVISDLCTDDFVQHGPLTGMELHGTDELMENIRQYHDAFSDLESHLEFAISDESGDYVCAYFTNTGTHDAELMGIPATDVDGKINAIGVYRFEDGLIAEAWIAADLFGLFSQLGESPDMDTFMAGAR